MAEAPLTIKKIDKLIVFLIAVGTALLSTVGSYIIFRTTTEYRITDLEKQQVVMQAAIKQQDEFGHPDYERRITKVEVRLDTTEKTVNEIKNQLDVAVAILNRIEIQINRTEFDRHSSQNK